MSALPFVIALLLWTCAPISAQALLIRTDELPWAIKGMRYQAEIKTSLDGRCPQGDVGLALAGGALPHGMELFSYGFDGTPTEMGEFHFTVRAANQCGATTKALKLIVTGKPILEVSPQRLTFQYRPGGAQLEEQMVRVASTWPNLPYSMELRGAPWLWAEQAEGRTPGPDSAFEGDRVRLRVDPGKLMPGVYYGLLKFSAWGGTNAPEVQVVLTVLKSD